MKNYSKKPQESNPIEGILEKVQPKIEQKPKKSIVKCRLNVRQLPTMSSPVVRILDANTKVVIEKEQDGFGFIGDGWVKLEFIAR